MRIFVFEWVCGGGATRLASPESSSRESSSSDSSQGVPLALLEEGFAMLHSIVDDFHRIHDVDEVVTIVDGASTEGLNSGLSSWPAGVAVRDIGRERGPAQTALEKLFDAQVAQCDATLVIAPEFDGQLLGWTQRVLDGGGQLLGSDPAAILLTADKLSLSTQLEARSIQTPAACAIDSRASRDELGAVTAELPLPWVVKPRFGAGCEYTMLVKDTDAASRALERFRRIAHAREMIATTFAPGNAASVSCLVGRDRVEFLAPGWQRIDIAGDGALRYDGGAIPLPSPELVERAVSLAQRVVETIPGLRGFVGIDLVLGDGDGVDSSHDSVIEVNARMTSSYPLLKRHESERNLARDWLTVLDDRV
jgi:predicted ATP-grasp superfamily ATP-dependent carboligase